jgi:acetyl esterase/lipase
MNHRISTVFLVCSLAWARAGMAMEPANPIIVLHDLRYRVGPSRQWRLDLAMKSAGQSKPRPAIVVVHGGGDFFSDPLPEGDLYTQGAFSTTGRKKRGSSGY